VTGRRQEAALALIGTVGSLARCDELGLGALAIGRVPDRGGDQHLLAILDRAQAYLDREFRAVRAPSEQVQSDSHGPDAHAVRIALPVRYVTFAKALGHEMLDPPADDVIVGIPE